MKKKTAIFLGFQPGVNLAAEGIGRLLAFLLKENDVDSDSVVLFCPAWLTQSIYELFKDNKISNNKFEIICTDNIPFGVRLKTYIKQRRNKKVTTSRIKQLIMKTMKKSLNLFNDLTVNFLGTTSLFYLLGKVIGYLLISIILLPFGILFSILYLLYSLFSKTKKKVNFFTERALANNSLIKKNKSLLLKARGIIYQRLIDNELKRVVALVNKHEEIKVCFIPSMSWPQIKGIDCKKVLASPDIVFYDFPTQFPGEVANHSRIRKSIEAADSIICYSEYVKTHHLVNKCGIDARKITVIKHANINMSEHLKVPKAIINYFTQKQNAQQIVNEFIRINYGNGHILSKSNIEQMNFIIYPSQCRPHKNINNLVKAIKIINRDMHRNVKLILTGDITSIKSIPEYIRANHLQNDIFVMHNLSSEILAAFTKLSKCAVNPTLFEGGFPFTFSEAYSVGTPSVMSNIPVVHAEIDDSHLSDLMLFDPYNPHSIAHKIIWAVDNAQFLFEAQDDLFKKFEQRDWKTVVREYNQVFRENMSK
ncbi:glycosyltransferase [Paenibacillus sp. FSL H8-0034]|uniref:glycosyltransferase n=1 Tax=Paenibacillus sp. FSL H8-0034 TaxID=2954671 RepID=UPI0030F86AF9